MEKVFLENGGLTILSSVLALTVPVMGFLLLQNNLCAKGPLLIKPVAFPPAFQEESGEAKKDIFILDGFLFQGARPLNLKILYCSQNCCL
jgi:hypothetical protein